MDEDGITIRDNLDECATNFYFYDENEKSIGSSIESMDIIFKNCTFIKKLELEKYKFQKSIVFKNCTFKNGILFNQNCNSSIEIDNYISDGTLLLQGITFHKAVEIKNTLDSLVITSCKFEDIFQLENIEDMTTFNLKFCKLEKGFYLINTSNKNSKTIIRGLDLSLIHI